jgi:hypothetical protein
MPIRFTYNSKVKILFTTAEGVISFEEIQAHLNGEWSAHRIGSRELVDASAASTNVTSDEARKIVAILLRMAGQQKFGPTAIVTNDNVVFGMTSMVQILSELRGGPAIGAFRSLSEGLNWLYAFAP